MCHWRFFSKIFQHISVCISLSNHLFCIRPYLYSSWILLWYYFFCFLTICNFHFFFCFFNSQLTTRHQLNKINHRLLHQNHKNLDPSHAQEHENPLVNRILQERGWEWEWEWERVLEIVTWGRQPEQMRCRQKMKMNYASFVLSIREIRCSSVVIVVVKYVLTSSMIAIYVVCPFNNEFTFMITDLYIYNSLLGGEITHFKSFLFLESNTQY